MYIIQDLKALYSKTDGQKKWAVQQIPYKTIGQKTWKKLQTLKMQ